MRDQAILRRLIDRKAIIMPEGEAGRQTFAAYPYGDRRRRPVSWLTKDMVTRMLGDGVLVAAEKGYAVASSKARRERASHAAQHRDIETETVSDLSGVFRPARVNQNAKSILRKLGTQMDGQGRPALSGAEIEAGERLAQDYARSSMSQSLTQNYESVGGGGAYRGPEDVSAMAIDARCRVSDALKYVGPGLDKAVSAVCCKEMGLEQMELAEGWAKRSGKTVLKLGLQRLAEFYGTHTGTYAANTSAASR